MPLFVDDTIFADSCGTSGSAAFQIHTADGDAGCRK
ncbi:hypothetical protein METH_22070 (plasmid) [Leisingera methylohalidivorans DSM 14336]|uniref:Uncharacterized protein n=1 Tax=Leisingera methylohalidivorans DSM 14336 TaxID=999552 RepID=V9W2V8_9RHOB|nr:hypothetical protein METH_22070 [Leisingera methylohalidivorans DSM 14336]